MSDPRDIGKEFTAAIRHTFSWARKLRALCESCSDEQLNEVMDFAIGIKELKMGHPDYAAVVKNVIEARRHAESNKPSRIETRGFWVGAISMILTFVFGVIGYLAWKHPVEPQNDSGVQSTSLDRPSYPLSPDQKSSPQLQPASSPTPALPLTNSVAAPATPKK